MSEMLARQAATTATLEKYRDKAFSWRNRHTCLHMLRFHLRQMGYTPESLPQINSLTGAKTALKERGWANVGDMLDTMLPRIAPAEMRLGDVAMFESDDGIGAITINLGGKVMGWHEDAPTMTALEPVKIAAAWRVTPSVQDA